MGCTISWNLSSAFLEEIGADYEWHDASEIYPEKSLKIHNPGMAPPYLFDVKSEKYLAQMPAILMHLAREHDYLPKRIETLDLALKVILDCNDVLMEVTNYYGQQMWNTKDWNEFRTDRLARWMKIFEQTGLDHGLKSDKGFLLGSKISVADIATTALFGTLIHSCSCPCQTGPTRGYHTIKHGVSRYRELFSVLTSSHL